MSAGLYTAPGLTVPYAFDVHGGTGRVLHVRGETIQLERPLGRGRTFSLREAAGLTVRQPRGRGFENILFDAQGQPLCRFGMSETNAEVFVQYLRSHGVPFYTPGGQMLEAPPDEDGEEGEKIQGTDLAKAFGPRFTVQLRQTEPVGVWIGGGIVLALLLFLAGFPTVAYFCYRKPYEDFALNALMVLTAALIFGPWVLAAVRGQLFPGRLSVEGDRLWLNGVDEIRLEDVAGLGWHASDECYLLYSKNGKILAKFSTRDNFGPQLMNFLTDHGVTRLPKTELKNRSKNSSKK